MTVRKGQLSQVLNGVTSAGDDEAAQPQSKEEGTACGQTGRTRGPGAGGEDRATTGVSTSVVRNPARQTLEPDAYRCPPWTGHGRHWCPEGLTCSRDTPS